MKSDDTWVDFPWVNFPKDTKKEGKLTVYANITNKLGGKIITVYDDTKPSNPRGD